MAAWRSTSELKTPRFRRRRVSVAKKVSTALSQEQEVGVKWKVQRGWRFEPGADLGVLVGGVVVEDGVDQLAGRHVAPRPVEEADELLVPVPLHALADDRAVEHVQRGEQGGGAVADVVVRHGASAALLHRQPRLRPVERLDLGLLVDREHEAVGRRIDIQPDDGAQLLGEAGSLESLKRRTRCGCEPVRAQIRCTERSDMPPPPPSPRPVQCVVSPGGSPSVSVDHALDDAPAARRDARRRVLSRSSPSTPAINRSCQRQTRAWTPRPGA